MAKIQGELAARSVGIVGISADPPEDSKKFAAKLGIEFPLVQDVGLGIARAYGVVDGEVAIPAVFVISREGVIVWQYIGERSSDRPTSALVLEQIDALQR
ncbi:MAG: peroxiredoxin family protein [Nannocystis sp.]|nr:peroxiredoxin family protein [Nannocystis sp.]